MNIQMIMGVITQSFVCALNIYDLTEVVEKGQITDFTDQF